MNRGYSSKVNDNQVKIDYKKKLKLQNNRLQNQFHSLDLENKNPIYKSR